MKFVFALLVIGIFTYVSGRETPLRVARQVQPTPDPSRLTVSSLGVVFQVPCPCPSTPEYNPVCGSDGRTYVNRQMLFCAQSCGFNVTSTRQGACSSPR